MLVDLLNPAGGSSKESISLYCCSTKVNASLRLSVNWFIRVRNGIHPSVCYKKELDSLRYFKSSRITRAIAAALMDSSL
jgi:hypothetical protein